MVRTLATALLHQSVLFEDTGTFSSRIHAGGAHMLLRYGMLPPIESPPIACRVASRAFCTRGVQTT